LVVIFIANGGLLQFHSRGEESRGNLTHKAPPAACPTLHKTSLRNQVEKVEISPFKYAINAMTYGAFTLDVK
jgi:hypothetical protein